MLDFYADESCKDAHHYFIQGCTIIETQDVPKVVQIVTRLRGKTNMNRELKWNKVSKGKISEYTEFVDAYFDMIRDGLVHFHCLIADAHKFDHKKFNLGSAEIGYNKLMYQLLIKAALRYKTEVPFYAYLDDRTTKHGLSELKDVLNNGFSKETDTFVKPFHRVVFRCSKLTDVLQLNDIIIGAVGFQKNEHDKRPGASPHKTVLAKHIASKAGLKNLCYNTPFSRNDFRIWNINLQ